jgi:N-methylhydantoinase B
MTHEAKAGNAMQAPDPVTVEIVKGALRATQAEMESVLERTAMSPIIREKQDYFCGLFDRQARLLIGTKIPVLGNILGPVLSAYPPETMQPGDLYWYNDCYGSDGGVSHSPDQVFVAPVFIGDQIVAYTHSWAHFLDIGGMRPGSTTPDATDIYQEGIMVPPVRLYQGGRLNDELFRTFIRNTRFPDMARGDMRAMMAAVRLGEKRLLELFQRYPQSVLENCFGELIAQTSRAVRQGMHERFTSGQWQFADCLDSDGQGSKPVTVRMSLTAAGDKLKLDTCKSDDQTRGAVNFLMHPSVPKMIFGIYFLAADQGLLLNEGVLDILDEVALRDGSVLRPRFPAALGQRTNTLARVQSSCLGLLDIADPARGHAGSSIYSFNQLRGIDSSTGKPFLKSMGLGVGHGARASADGIDAVYFIAQKNYPVEFTEQNFPLRIRGYGINLDSAGPGRWRGGAGVYREVEVLTERAMLGVRMDNVDNPPWGVAGGLCGRSGRILLNRGTERERKLRSMEDGIIVQRGDIIRFECVGGGGYGHPFDREPERVMNDVLDGFVSPASALSDYGVVLSPDGESVDLAATSDYRSKHRWPTRLFHRGTYLDATEWYASHAA